MTSLLHNLAIVVGTGIVWFLTDYLNREYFSIFKISDFIYVIYIPAGYRLIAVITFGWLGALSVGLAYAIRVYFFRDMPLPDSLILATLYALAPLIAYKAWEKIFQITPSLLNMSVENLFWLSCISAFFNAIFRVAYFYYANMPYGFEEFTLLISGNLAGTFIVLYALKICARIYYNFSQRNRS
ncbi:hypothetical protein FD960_07480 [Polynucleobacter sp. AP-Nino-20-G2]|nr:hypothetical protein FD960_07480 [Polynucleobacter sp. AP-Nino-20-G2]